jgi:hypothetical protein
MVAKFPVEEDWSAVYPPDMSTVYTYQESMGVSGGASNYSATF